MIMLKTCATLHAPENSKNITDITDFSITKLLNVQSVFLGKLFQCQLKKFKNFFFL